MKTDLGIEPRNRDAACSGRCIALIEDSPADTKMIRFALHEVDPAINVMAFERGTDALQYFAAASVNDTCMPCDLLLVDLNLPALSGLEVLELIRANDHLRMLPVVILSGSSNPSDVERCYLAGANSYVTKPTNLDDLLAIMARLVTYWYDCASLPSGSLVAPRALAPGN